LSDARDHLRSISRGRSPRQRRKRCVGEQRPWVHEGTNADKARWLKAALQGLADEHHAGVDLSPVSREIADSLLYIAGDPVLLAPYWDRFRKHGPGVSGISLRDLEAFGDRWAWLREWRAALVTLSLLPSSDTHESAGETLARFEFLSQIYGPNQTALWGALGSPLAAPLRRVWVAKKVSGKMRALDLSECWDAFPEKGLQLVTQPLLDAGLTDAAGAYRPGVGVSDALAMALAEAEARNCHVMVAMDLTNAFGAVPHPRLESLLRRRVPSSETVDVIMRYMRPDRREDGRTSGTARGVPQGSALGPGLFNCYGGEYLDKPWQRRFPELPLVRWADDVLILAPSKREARRGHREYAKIAGSAGFGLKESKTRRVNMHHGSLDWLGHQISRRSGRYVVSVPEECWRQIECRIRSVRPGLHGDLIDRICRGFLTFHGPAWASQRIAVAVARLQDILAESGKAGSIEDVRRRRKAWMKVGAKARDCWKRKLCEASVNAKAEATIGAGTSLSMVGARCGSIGELGSHPSSSGEGRIHVSESRGAFSSNCCLDAGDSDYSNTDLTSPAVIVRLNGQATSAAMGKSSVATLPGRSAPSVMVRSAGQPDPSGPAARPPVSSSYYSGSRRHGEDAFLQFPDVTIVGDQMTFAGGP
jgi:hypothetical protein